MSKSKAMSPQVLLGLRKTMPHIRLLEETVAELFKKGLFQDAAPIESANTLATLPGCSPNSSGGPKTR